MNTFMIGQYGKFDEQKYTRDFQTSFYGVEACLFERESDIVRLRNEARRNGFQIGIHFPMRAGGSELRDALFLAQDSRVRQEAFDYIQRELDYVSAIDIQPAYILFHYPKPVILDDRVNWASWRFSDTRDYVLESVYSFAEFTQNSETLFDWLSAKGNEYGFTPVLEFDALNAYIYETDFLEKLLDKYPSIKLCLDTGRMHVQEKIDPHFRAALVIKKYARYAHMIHLWNMRCTDKFEYNHYPALPECRPEDGWAPIEQYVKLIVEENPHVKVMFEHRSDMINDEQLERCYTWIDQLVNSGRSST